MKIQITGEIVDAPFMGECFCPQDLKGLLEGVDENEPLEVEITSEGGSVFAGIQIANMLARHKGQVTTHGVGLVASIATVILMAGKKVVVDENCFLLLHNPWTMVQGNANDLEKEIDALNKCKAAMMGYYKKHSKIGEEELTQILDNETWFLGTEFADIFDAEVLESDRQLDIAAKFDLTKFKTLPRGLKMKNENELPIEEEEKKTTKEVVEEEKKDETPEEEITEEVIEETKEETNEDGGSDEPDVEELKKKIEELTKENEELKSKLAECQKEEKAEEVVEEEKKVEQEDDEVLNKAQVQARISGIQSSMQKQINDFKSQLKAKEEELKSAQADVTRLTESLEKTSKELSEMASAFEEKQAALDKLNSNVNAQAEEIPTMKDGLAKCATPAEKVAFLKSGKYTK